MNNKRVIASSSDFNRLIEDDNVSNVAPLWLLSIRLVALATSIFIAPSLFLTTAYPFFYTGPQGFGFILIAVFAGVSFGIWRLKSVHGLKFQGVMFAMAILFSFGFSYATAGIITLQGQKIGFPMVTSLIFAVAVISIAITLQIRGVLGVYHDMVSVNADNLFKQLFVMCAVISLIYSTFILPIHFKGYEPIFFVIIFLALSLRINKRFFYYLPLAASVLFVAFTVNYTIGTNIVHLSGKDSRLEVEKAGETISGTIVNNVVIPRGNSLYNSQIALNLLSLTSEKEKALIVGGLQQSLLSIVEGAYLFKILSSDIVATSLISSLDASTSKQHIDLTPSITSALIDDDTKYSLITEFIYSPFDNGDATTMRMKFKEYKRLLVDDGRFILQYPKVENLATYKLREIAYSIFSDCVDISGLDKNSMDALVCVN